jgi:hypothetical protein
MAKIEDNIKYSKEQEIENLKINHRPIAKILFNSIRKKSVHSNESKISNLTNYTNQITNKFDEDLDSLSDISSFELDKKESKSFSSSKDDNLSDDVLINEFDNDNNEFYIIDLVNKNFNL